MTELFAFLIFLVKEWPPAMTGLLVTVYYLLLRKDIKRIQELVIELIEKKKEYADLKNRHAKESLGNPVTDTNKEVDKLKLM